MSAIAPADKNRLSIRKAGAGRLRMGGANGLSLIGAAGAGVSLTAPILNFASATSPSNDNTQDFTIDVPPDTLVGDEMVVVAKIGTDFAGSSPAEYDIIDTYTIVSGDVGGGGDFTGEITLPLTPDGVAYCRAFHKRSSSFSGPSPTISKTIDTTAPTITSSNSGNNTENSTLAKGLTANETVTWSITGGADAARFEIATATLRWASNGVKDYETPNDADTNNTYVVQVTATDTAGNATPQTITITVVDADDTAPTLSSPTDTATGPTTADAVVTTNEANGTLYCVVTTSGTAPSAAQVKLGKDNSGVTATYAANVAVSSTGAKTFNATGLTAATAYTAHFMHEDAVGNQSAVSSGNGLTTSSSSTTWNPSDKNAQLSLSGGDLIVTDGTAGYSCIRAIASASSGKKYCEFTVTAGSSDTAIGVSNASWPLGNPLGQLASSLGYERSGAVTILGSSIGNAAAWTVGDVIGMAFDMDNSKVWFRVNGGNWNNAAIGSQNPATNTGGFSTSTLAAGPWFPTAYTYFVGAAWTANFGGSAYGAAAPSGFGNW